MTSRVTNMNVEVTQILQAIRDGHADAPERLYRVVYEELRQVAARKMSQERAGHTLQPTALVHEAYLRLLDGVPDDGWQNRRHFFAAAAETMRRILVESARRRMRLKRGGERQRQSLSAVEPAEPLPDDNLPALDTALTALEEEEPDKAELVKLRYFAGLSLEDTAEMLGISRATASRHWAYARAWLFEFIEG